jgi:hypothetical protein
MILFLKALFVLGVAAMILWRNSEPGPASASLGK